jgi:outer membrane receptor protein involved in Fe transport
LISQRQLAARAAAVAAGVTPPFGAVGAGTGTVPALGAGQARITANYRVTQISNRIAADDRNAYRMLAGVRGEIVENLNYDVSYMLARTKNAQVQTGNVSRSAFATNVGNGTCNVFGANLLSDQCITNISITAQNQEESRLQVAQASISGSLFQIPSATSAVGFAAGVEYRKMAAEFIPDTALSSGDVVGFNAGLPTEGDYDAKEVFGELRVPIVNEGFLHKFELNAAARYSDYSLDNVGGVPAYAVGAELAPIRDVTFRAQYQRAVRAPNVQELFGGTSVGFPPATDPCSSRNPVANRTEELRQLCIATGVPAENVFGGIQPNAQIEGIFGGNPDLEEEVGDTYTGGVILRPSFIPRLNLAVDYYRIRIKNAINPAGGGVGGILDLCYNIVADASSPICALINRDPSGIIAGPPFVVSALNANLSSFTARGVDTQLDYTMPLGMGLASPASRLNFYVFGSYTLKNGFTRAPGDPGIDCEGRFGLLCGNPTPKWKHTARVSWLDGPVTTSLRWRFLGKVKDDDDQTDYVVERIKSYSLFDLTFGVDVTDQATLNFGVNNLFDKKPPIIGDNQEQSNTYPSAYDVIGRDFFVSAAFRF